MSFSYSDINVFPLAEFIPTCMESPELKYVSARFLGTCQGSGHVKCIFSESIAEMKMDRDGNRLWTSARPLADAWTGCRAANARNYLTR